MIVSSIDHLTFDNTDSREEVYTFWYLLELLQANFIHSIDYHPGKMKLYDPIFLTYNHLKRNNKGGNKQKTFSLFRGKEYEPDFIITWKMGIGLFHIPIDKEFLSGAFLNDNPTKIPFFSHKLGGDFVSYIDTKGYGGRSDTKLIFSIVKKLVYHECGIYINEFVPDRMFKNTFMPSRYLFQDKAKGTRKLKYDVTSLQTFIDTNTNIIVYDDTNYEDHRDPKIKVDEKIHNNPGIPTNHSTGRSREKEKRGFILFEDII